MQGAAGSGNAEGTHGRPQVEKQCHVVNRERKAVFIFLIFNFFRQALLIPLCARTAGGWVGGGRSSAWPPGEHCSPAASPFLHSFLPLPSLHWPPEFPRLLLLRVWGAHAASQLSLPDRKTKTRKEKALISRPVRGREAPSGSLQAGMPTPHVVFLLMEVRK